MALNDQAEDDDKVRENRLRRMAQRQGLRLEKSRRRDRRALDYGRYWLVRHDGDSRRMVGPEQGMTLDDAEKALTSRTRKRRKPIEVRPADLNLFGAAVASWSSDEQDLLTQLRAGETVVVNLHGQHANLIAWATSTGLYVRIDRHSTWGNPFKCPADGDRDTVIRNYTEHYLPYKPSLQGKRRDLRGKALGCWCAPEACHGDVLKRWCEEGDQ